MPLDPINLIRGISAIKHSTILVFWILILVTCYGVWDARRGPTPANIPVGPLLDDVAALARIPHPIGSEEAKRQRARLTSQFESLGLEVSLQQTLVQYQHPLRGSGQPRVAWVENIIAQLPGTPGNDTLALMSHYDSGWQTPGAADAASGVAAVLAAARAAVEMPQRTNNLVFLLTDGEEMGLFGAQAFFRQHELAKSVNLVLNFEARGNQGPPQMFQTSPGNAGLIETLDHVMESPMANSLSFEVYRRMPNDTDLTISLGEEIPGLNFAFVDGFPNYHAMTDRPSLLSQRSLLQQAENAVRLTTHLANSELSLASNDSNMTYFNFSSQLFVAYPLSVVWSLLAITFAVVVLGLRNALRKHVLSWKSLFSALAALLAIALLVSGFSASFKELYLGNVQWRDAGFWRYFHLYQLNFLGASLLTCGGVLWLGRRLSHGVPWGWLSGVFVLLLAMGWWSGLPVPAAVVVIASALLLLAARGGLAPAAWLAAFSLLWLAVATGLVVMLPHASYVAILLSLPAGVALAFAQARVSGDDISGWSGLLWIPSVLVLSSLIYNVYLGLGTFTPQLPLALAALLMAGILVPLAAKRSVLSTVLISAGIAILVIAPIRFNFTDRQPQPSGLFTLTNTDAGTTHWASRDDQPPAWAMDVMGSAMQAPLNEIIPASSRSLWRSEQSFAAIHQGPLLVAQVRDTGELNITASADAPMARMYFEPAESVASIRIDGQTIKTNKPSSLRLFGMPAGTTIEIAPASGVGLTIYWHTALPGLPTSAPLRPTDHMPAPGTWSDTQIWHGTIDAR